MLLSKVVINQMIRQKEMEDNFKLSENYDNARQLLILDVRLRKSV